MPWLVKWLSPYVLKYILSKLRDYLAKRSAIRTERKRIDQAKAAYLAKLRNEMLTNKEKEDAFIQFIEDSRPRINLSADE